jgi:2-keto-3-deoxy-L-rhamnonate aldolase RhmA
MFLASVFVLACVALVTIRAQAPAAGAQAPAGGGGGRGTAAGPPTPGTLITGAWGEKTLPVDPKGWGYQSKMYVSPDYKRPFFSKAKEMLFSGKQVTSFTISSLNPALYCEVRKHYGYVWFEMQHSTMSWDDVAKMEIACPGPDGATPMVRMPDQLESSIQKATDIGSLGLIFPTMRDGHQALEAARYSRYPPFGRRSSGGSQAGRVWAGAKPEYSRQSYNDNMLVTVMIETLDGMINADEIAGTFGLDIVIQGNNDLSAFSGWAQTDPRYQALLNISRNAAMKNGKWWGNAGQQYLTGNPLSADTRFVQNGPAIDGWTNPAGRGGRSATPPQNEEPTIGLPGGASPSGAATPAAPGGAGGGRGRGQ